LAVSESLLDSTTRHGSLELVDVADLLTAALHTNQKITILIILTQLMTIILSMCSFVHN